MAKNKNNLSVQLWFYITVVPLNRTQQDNLLFETIFTLLVTWEL